MSKTPGAPPDTALFSRAYLRPAQSQRDSKRFRTRLYALFDRLMSETDQTVFYKLVREELGVTMPGNQFGVSFSQFFADGELRDLMDSVTLARRIFIGRSKSQEAKHWADGVRRIFEEEALGYKLNEYGAVRALVDEEFERTRFATIDGLTDARFAAVREAVETAFAKLDREPFDTKGAVRSFFEAVETLCKVQGAHNDDLDAGMVKKRIQPLASRLYGKLDTSAQSFAEQTIVEFIAWVNAGHKYRHGPKAEDPHHPPLELTIAYLSSGAAFIRFLIDLETRARANAA